MSGQSKPGQRPRPVFIGLIGAVMIAVIAWIVWPAASQTPSPSNQRVAGTLPGQLEVRLEALKQPPPQPDDAGRNPFRFYVKPPPPPPPPPKYVPPPPSNPGPPLPPPPPPIPPIPLKFIGTLEVTGKKKQAIFSDGKGSPLYGAEGELVLGQYRIIRIGVESVVMEYADGKGRQTIPMRGI
jgi:hypothetical protein